MIAALTRAPSALAGMALMMAMTEARSERCHDRCEERGSEFMPQRLHSKAYEAQQNVAAFGKPAKVIAR